MMSHCFRFYYFEMTWIPVPEQVRLTGPAQKSRTELAKDFQFEKMDFEIY